MQEEVHIISPSPVNGKTPHGLPTPSNDVPSKGFTAVNGEYRTTMSFRPDASARPTIITNMTNGDPARMNTPNTASTSAHSSYTPHNWRPDDRGPEAPRSQPQGETPTGNKRRRLDSPGGRPREGVREDHPYTTGASSPKRRFPAGGPEDGSTPERTSQSRAYSHERQDLPPTTIGTYGREPSPVLRADRVDPPPPPRPEVVDKLAASLEASLDTRPQDQHHRSNRSPSIEPQQSIPRQQQANARSPSPAEPDSPDSPEGQQPNDFGPDQEQSGENDPKKRKRNFSNRTKTGCHTCRARKKKCDEGKPTCENCKRGSFECGGYGPKPPGSSKISATRQHIPIQARHFDGRPAYHEPPPHVYQHGSPRPPGPWDPVRHDAYPPPAHHYGPPPPMDHRPPSGRDSWGPRPAWGAEPAPTYLSERLPPVDYSSVPPPHAYPSRYQDFRPPPDPWASQHAPSRLPPVPPPLGISSRESVHSSHSGNSGGSHSLMLPPSGPATGARAKMLTGQPYHHYLDPDIQLARKTCARAVEAYNNACLPSSTVSVLEQARHFRSIIDPSQRTSFENLTRYDGPIGAVGSRTIVASPFSCEFGFNISLGNDSVIEAGCLMQDAGPIVIGDRVIVGPNVSFCTLTASVDANLRSGSQGNFVAGAIKVEDDVYIGANVTVMPFRTIGKGAQVGAGSVVTRDVKPYTVVAGNPAKPVRKRRIESGPNVDRHDDSIQEENDKMLEWMKKKFANPVRPSTEGGGMQ